MATPIETLAMVAGRIVGNGKGISSGIDGNVLAQSLLAQSSHGYLDAASQPDSSMGTDDDHSMCSFSAAMEALNTPPQVHRNQAADDTNKTASLPGIKAEDGARQLTTAELSVYVEQFFLATTIRLEAMEYRLANGHAASAEPSDSHVKELVADRCEAAAKELSQELEAKLMRMTVCSTEQLIKRLDQTATKLAHALEENEKDWMEETQRIWEAVHSHTHEVNLGKAHAQDATMTGSVRTMDLHSVEDGSEILHDCTLDLSRVTGGSSSATMSFALGWDDSTRLVDDFELPTREQDDSPSVSVILPPGPPLPQEDYEKAGRKRRQKCHEPTCVEVKQSATQAQHGHLFEKSMSLPQLDKLALQRETENAVLQPANDGPTLVSPRKQVAAASAVEPDLAMTAPAQAVLQKPIPVRAPTVPKLSQLSVSRNSAASALALISPRMMIPKASHWSPSVEHRQAKDAAPPLVSPSLVSRNSATVLPKTSWSPLVENRQNTEDKSVVITQQLTGPPVQRAPASLAYPQNGPNVGHWRVGSRRSLHRVGKPEV